MPWYHIINANSDNYVADRDAEDLLRHLATALQTADGPVDADVFYGRTAHGARRYSVSLAPEAVALAERVLASSDATALMVPPDLTGMEQNGSAEQREQRRRIYADFYRQYCIYNDRRRAGTALRTVWHC